MGCSKFYVIGNIIFFSLSAFSNSLYLREARQQTVLVGTEIDKQLTTITMLLVFGCTCTSFNHCLTASIGSKRGRKQQQQMMIRLRRENSLPFNSRQGLLGRAYLIQQASALPIL